MNDTTSQSSPLKIKARAKFLGSSEKQDGIVIRILCPSCEFKNQCCISNVFDKVKCHQCEKTFRVPAQTSNFNLFNLTFETDYFEIFKAQSKASGYLGAVVSYDKLHFKDPQHDMILSTIRNYMDISDSKYITPEEVIETDHCYSVFRCSPTYMMNVYLRKNGKVEAAMAGNILANVAHIANKLAKRQIFDLFLPSDIMLSQSTGAVFLADYGLRGELINIMGQHSELFVEMMAPETASKRPHSEASAVYSLGIIAHLFLTGEYPFTEVNPQYISRERSKYLKDFDTEKLPDFLPRMLSMEIHERPSFAECFQLFSDFSASATEA